MAKIFCIPGILFLTVAFLLSLLATISLPWTSWSDLTRIDFGAGLGSIAGIPDASGELRLGIWGYCYQRDSLNPFYCTHTGSGYSIDVLNIPGAVATIDSSLTRGLPFHAFACAVVGIAWLLSFSEHVTVTLIASLTSFFAALLTLIAFILDIVLLARTKSHLSSLAALSSSTRPGPAFWFTLVAFILLLLAGCTVCFGHRRARQPRESDEEYTYGRTRGANTSRFWRRGEKA